MKLATKGTAEIPADIREAIGPGWHLVCASVDEPDTWMCLEVERRDVDRFLTRVEWHPHPYRDPHRVEIGELVEVAGFEYVLAAHPADEHTATRPS
jgi:hypothetical protein